MLIATSSFLCNQLSLLNMICVISIFSCLEEFCNSFFSFQIIHRVKINQL